MKWLLKLTCVFFLTLISKNSLAKNSGSLNNTNTPKLYVSTNKEMYVKAETVYYQAFTISSESVIPKSLFLFSELYDCSGKKILKEKLPLVNGSASGSFSLPEQQSDYYLLYCFTVDNKGKLENDFIRKVVIRNNPLNLSTNANAAYSVSDLSINYFFEGGTFVSELSNNILIKICTKEDNKPVSVSGKIINQKNEVLQVFNTDNHGMVKLELIPYPDEKLFLVMQDNKHNLRTIPLTVASTEGLAFRIFYIENEIFYIAQLNAKNSDMALEYSLGIFDNDQLVYQGDLKFDPGKSQVYDEIKKINLPHGYLTLRITDKNNKVIVERLFYNDENKRTTTLQVIDSLTHKTYNIDLPDYVSGKGYVSINAFEKTKSGMIDSNATTMSNSLEIMELDSSWSNSLFSDLLISLPKAGTHINRTSQVAGNEFLTISGTLYSNENKPLKNKKVNIIITESDRKKQFYTVTTNDLGWLQLTNLLFFDTATIQYQLADKSENKNKVTLVLDIPENPLPETNTDWLKKFLCVNTGETNTRAKDSIVNAITSAGNKEYKVLKPVVINAAAKKTEKELFVKKYVSPQYDFAPALDKEFDFITNPEENFDFQDVYTYIRSKIVGVAIINGEIRSTSGNSIDFLNPRAKDIQGAPVQVYVDEMLTEDLSILNSLKIHDVALIRFYSSVWSPKITGLSGGSLIIYTKKGDAAQLKSEIGLPKLEVYGYNSHREQVNETTQPADYKTLYWEPNSFFTDNKIVYTNLQPHNRNILIRIKIEGINDYNIPFTFTKTIVTE